MNEGHGLRVKVVRPDELGTSEAELWTKFQQISEVMSSPFLSLTFVQAVGRVRPSARVAVVEEGGQTEAFLPFEMTSKRVALPIGWPMNDLQGFIGSGMPIDARAVVKAAGLRGWRFDHVPAGLDVLIPYHYGPAIQCPVIDLSDGYDTYLETRKRRLKAEHRRSQRNLAREIGPVSLEWDSADWGHVRQLLDWKTGRYAGAEQIFSDPANRQLLTELASADNDECRVNVCVLFAGDRVVATSLDLRARQSLHGWMQGFDQELSRFGPGNLLLMAISEAAPDRGIRSFDLGYGQHDYKFRLANSSYPVAGGAVWASRVEEIGRRIYRQLVQRG